MKLNAGTGILIAFAALVAVALIIVANRPVSLVPMDGDMIKKTGVSVMLDESGMANLPVLAASMPDFVGIQGWLNTADEKPLTKADLEGKVVMIDFWTYSCINCIRTQPVLRGWWDTYKDDGLVIIGVHTPEFAFEKDPENVRDAVRRAGLEYPIALDPEYGTWRAYNNRFWPAAYFFDRQGRLRFTHFGEGEYDEQEAVIRALLAEGGELTDAPTGLDSTPAFETIRTPETYFGHLRLEHLENTDEFVRGNQARYSLTAPRENYWSLGGDWVIEEEYAANQSMNAQFSMNAQANAMHVVLGTANGPRRLRVQIDGRDPSDEELTEDTIREAEGVFITVTRKDLYRVARFPDASRHVVTLTIDEPGAEFYAATFGE